MKSFLFNYRYTTNIILPIIITAAIFYSDSLEQRISEIQSDYIIDTNTLNNSFITLSINIHAENAAIYQKTKDDLKVQMDKFNKKYEQEEKEREAKKLLQKWGDKTIYALTFLLIIFNVLIFSRNTRQTEMPKLRSEETTPKPGIYKHYKGNLYEVIGIAMHSETKERFVIYRAVYPVRGRPAEGAATTALGRSASNGASGDYELWARPEKMFFENVDMPEYNYKGPRFQLVKEF